MPSRFSLIPLALDGLVTGLRATTGFRAPDSPADGITVYDGAEGWVDANSTDVQGFLVVGYGGEDLETRQDDDNKDSGTSVTGDSAIRAMGPRLPKEYLNEIPCVAYAWSGDATLSTVRAAAFDIVGKVEAWLTANDQLGVATQLDGAQILTATATGSHGLRQYFIDGGPRAVVEFTVSITSRT